VTNLGPYATECLQSADCPCHGEFTGAANR
jgi:hypothetical protein